MLGVANDSGFNGAVVQVLRDERLAAGLTIEDVSERSGIPAAYLQRLSAATRRITATHFIALCTALGLDAAAVVDTAWDNHNAATTATC